MKSRLLVLLLAAVFALTACSTQKKLESDDDFSVEAEDSANKGKVEDLALEQPAANTNSNADDLSLDTAPATTDAAAQPKPTKSANQESDLALENELNSLDNSAGGAQPTNKANQNDLSLEEPATNTAQTPPPAQDLNQNNPQNQSAEIPPPAIVTPEATATTPPPAETVTPSDGTVATINNVQYKGNVNGGTIAIAADKPVQFTTRLNATTNQFVVEVQNSKIPQKLKRSLNTKDMASSIGSVDIYQKEGSNVSRFVVQLRPGSPNPIVQQEGNSLLIIASGNKAAMAAQSAAQAAPQDNGAQASPNLGTPDAGSISADMGTLNSPAEVSTATAGTGSSTTLVDGDAGNAASTGTDLNLAQSHKGILTYDNLDEFLMGDTKYYGKKINLETSGMDTSEALKFLAEESGVNIMLDDSVMNVGKVNIKLKEVPWDQAFVLILKAKRLVYKRQGNVIRVASLEDVKKEEDEALKLKDSRKVPEQLSVKRFFISYADITELKDKVDEYLKALAAANKNNSSTRALSANQVADTGTQAVGKVIIDKRNNSLIVTDTATNLKKIEEIIVALDMQPKQILIESKVIEASETFAKGLGVQWHSTATADSAAKVNSGTLGISSSVQIPATFNAQVTWGQIDFLGSLSPTLLLGESQNLIKTLASPRVTVVSNTQASISQTEDVQVPVATTNPVTGVVQQSTVAKPVGVTLGVTPVATNQGTVNLKLTLTRSQGATAGTSTRTATTELFVKSGSTAVVGGIYLTTDSDDNDGVPVLRSIPVLGSLFESRAQTKTKSELMIFVTPTILKPL